MKNKMTLIINRRIKNIENEYENKKKRIKYK